MITPITFPSALEFWSTYDNRIKPVTISDVNNAFKEVGSINMQKANHAYISSKKLCQSNSENRTFESAKKPMDMHFNDPPEKTLLLDFATRHQISTPLHVMVPRLSMRHQGKSLICHAFPQGIPSESVIIIQDVPIICPELCFLLAAEYLPLQDLALLATDLSGTYALSKQASLGQIDRLAVTSVQNINNYLNQVHRVNGITKARKSIRFALDNSHSPIESKLAVTVLLPLLYGGFAADQPELNAIVHLSSSGKKLFGPESCCVDLLWRKQRLVVEYDSDLVHSSMKQIRKDKRKANALKMSGYTVINITKDYFRNYTEAENLFLMIRQLLRIRNRPQSIAASNDARYKLIKHFFLSYDAQNWQEWACSQSGKRRLKKNS